MFAFCSRLPPSFVIEMDRLRWLTDSKHSKVVGAYLPELASMCSDGVKCLAAFREIICYCCVLHRPNPDFARPLADAHTIPVLSCSSSFYFLPFFTHLEHRLFSCPCLFFVDVSPGT